VSVGYSSAQDAAEGTVFAKSNQKEVDSSQFQPVQIGNVFITGNRKTKEKIILRELTLKPGTVYPKNDLPLIIQKDREKLINTRLFLEVEIQSVDRSEDVVDLVVQVKERWYFFPSPIFKLADRSFNEWWANQGRDLSRVNYGVRLTQYNFRGRRETLRFVAQFGFSKTFALNYRVPFFDKKQRNGLMFDFGYRDEKNLAYRSSENKQAFLESEEILKKSYSSSLTWTHRYSFYNRHFFTLGFYQSSINDTIAFLNPNYFLEGRTTQRYFTLSYLFTRDLRDDIAYPLNGHFISVKAEKNGLGIFDDLNRFSMRASYAQYFPLARNYFLSSRITGVASFPKRQAYNNTEAIGYQPDDLRGYDLYVVEGQNYLIHKITFKKLLFSKQHSIKSIPIPQFQTIPIAVYLKTFFDSGYVNNEFTDPENTALSNRYLFGGGLGLDIVTYYDLVLRLEYSINDRGNTGFFLNVRADI
jgi:outer membrane protein assembly factor BamA